MSVITTAQDGEWTSASTWTGGTVPGAGDTAQIQHRVHILPTGNINVDTIIIDGGGIVAEAETQTYIADYYVNANHFFYRRYINDTMPLRLDGAHLGITPGIYCTPVPSDGFEPTYNLTQANFIIEDPGYFSQTTTLQDVKPEGCGKAYARKVSNNVRFLTFNVRIPQDKRWGLRYLYLLAEGPFQVVAITDSCLIKGHIETVAPDPSSVGKEYISVKVTIAEGPRQ